MENTSVPQKMETHHLINNLNKNYTSKTLTKTLASRLQKTSLLTSLLDSDQVGYISGRYIAQISITISVLMSLSEEFDLRAYI